MANTAKTTNGYRADRALAARQTFTPRVDILESAQELVLLADLPGVRADDVEVHFERGELTVFGRVTSPPRAGTWLAGEYRAGDFYRAFLIGQEVDAAGIHAELRHGVLTVHLPKASFARARRIPVQGA